MARVVACYKWVIDEEDIRIRDDLSIDMSKARMKISGYDRNAIEAAVQAAKALEATAVGLNYGTAKAKKSVKDALARGLDELVRIEDEDADNADNAKAAAMLVAGIGMVDEPQLVVMAEGASDDFARQTAARVAAKLDWPVATCVSALKVEGGSIRVTRTLEDTMETLDIDLPAVVSVLPEICEVPIPSLKQIVAAGKKPNKTIKASELGVGAESKRVVERVEGYASNRKNVVIDGSDADAVEQLVSALHKEGVL